jgi:PPM family protein phosphatase
MLRIISHGITDVGLKRTNNEDALAMDPETGFWAVADGMGGAAAGEVASRIFIETAYDVFSTKTLDALPLDLVREVFGSANTKIISEANRHSELDGMGCTAELITFREEEYFLGHVGDSRTYVYRNGQLRQITRDHSFIQDQLDKGLITPEEARTNSFRNVILRAVGVSESLSIDLCKGRALDGDIFLLCSDGLTDMVDDTVIHDAFTLPYDLAGKVERLVSLAKSAGGKDNITVVLCQVEIS